MPSKVYSLKEQAELIKPFVTIISQLKQRFGVNPADNYFYRIIQAANLVSVVDSSIKLGRPRPTKKEPNDYTNSRTSLGESKSCYIKKCKGKYKDGSFEFTNQNMPKEQRKLNSYESFMFSVNNENEEVLFVVYLNDSVSVDEIRKLIRPKQQEIQTKYDPNRDSTMRPSLTLKVSEILKIPNCRIVDNNCCEVDSSFVRQILGWEAKDNSFFGHHA